MQNQPQGMASLVPLFEAIRSALDYRCAGKIVHLSEVTPVDVAMVRLLIQYEDEEVKLARCPTYVVFEE